MPRLIEIITSIWWHRSVAWTCDVIRCGNWCTWPCRSPPSGWNFRTKPLPSEQPPRLLTPCSAYKVCHFCRSVVVMKHQPQCHQLGKISRCLKLPASQCKHSQVTQGERITSRSSSADLLRTGCHSDARAQFNSRRYQAPLIRSLQAWDFSCHLVIPDWCRGALTPRNGSC